MADEPPNAADESSEPGTVQALEAPGEELEHVAEERVPEAVTTPAPVLLPGEIRPHPTPFKYVVIAAVLVVVTAAEVGLYYLQGDIPDGLLIALLLSFAFVKFTLVAS